MGLVSSEHIYIVTNIFLVPKTSAYATVKFKKIQILKNRYLMELGKKPSVRTGLCLAITETEMCDVRASNWQR